MRSCSERQASRFSAEPVLIHERARATGAQAQAESGQLIIEEDRVLLPLWEHGSIDGLSSEFHDQFAGLGSTGEAPSIPQASMGCPIRQLEKYHFQGNSSSVASRFHRFPSSLGDDFY